MARPEKTDTVPIRHFSESLPMLLLRAREAVMVRFRAMLREQGLTEQQWRVLRALATRDSFEVSELASATFLLAPSLSRILADLEGLTLITVHVQKLDQRKKTVRLAQRGRSLIEDIAPLSEAIYADIAARIGAARLAELQDLLREAESALRATERPVSTRLRRATQMEAGQQPRKRLTR